MNQMASVCKVLIETNYLGKESETQPDCWIQGESRQSGRNTGTRPQSEGTWCANELPGSLGSSAWHEVLRPKRGIFIALSKPIPLQPLELKHRHCK